MVPDITTMLLFILLVCSAVSTRKQRAYYGGKRGTLSAAKVGKSATWGLGRSLVLVGVLLAVAILLLVACSPSPKPALSPKFAEPGGSAHTGVSPSGAYQTSVPIAVPSYHGLEPMLALTYNSRGGNGWVGVGWNLSGLSSILRASPGRGVPRYDGSDVYYLDGAELLPCASGMTSPSCLYPDPTSPELRPYTTRIESFQRIAWNPQYPSGSWFVWSKSGTKMVYLSRRFTGPLPVAWDLASIQDTLDKTVSYTYWQDNAIPSSPSPEIGESYPQSISYNGTVVKFYYELRPDIMTYANGSDLVVVRYRLKTIDVTVGGVQVRAYTLTYITRPESSSRSLLSQVQQFGDDVVLDTAGSVTSGTPLPPMKLVTQSIPGGATGNWTGHSAPPISWPAAATGNPYDDTNSYKIGSGTKFMQTWDGNRWFAGDLNGDGRQDLILVTSLGNSFLGVGTAISRADGTHLLQVAAPSLNNPPTWNDLDFNPDIGPYGGFWFPGDINGDGKTDIIGTSESHGKVVLLAGISNGDGSFRYLEQHTDIPWEPVSMFSDLTFDFSISLGIGPLGLSWGGTIYQSRPNVYIPQRWLTGDVNGDGRTDLVLAAAQKHRAPDGSTFFTTLLCTFLSTGEGFAAQPCKDTGWDDSPDVRLKRFFTGDVLGDGRSDIMMVSQYTRDSHKYVRFNIGLSNGDGSFTPVTYDTNQPWQEDDIWFPGDPNGDGKTDLMQVIKNDKPSPHAVLKSWLSDGSGHSFIPTKEYDTGFNWYLPHPCIGDWTPTLWFPGDANGDGRTDFMHVYSEYNHNCLTNSDQRVSVAVVAPRADGTYNTTTRDTGLRWDLGQPGSFVPADINGDGKTDIVFASGHNPTGIPPFKEFHWWQVDTVLSPNTRSDSARWQAVDVNGDGRADLVYVEYLNPGVRVYTALQQGDGTYRVVANNYFPDFANPDCRHWMTVELGGGARAGPDGRTDLAYVDKYRYVDDKGVLHQGIRVYTLLSNGDGTWIPNVWNYDAWPQLHIEDTLNWIPMDVNGDGLTDLVHVASFNQDQTIQVNVLLANPGGGFTPVYHNNDFYLGFHAPDTQNWMPMDVNGDGKMDLVYLSYLNPGLRITTLLSNGDGHWTIRTQPNAWPDFSSQGARDWRVMDVNGDGMMDLVHLSSTYSTLGIATLLSVGNGTDWVLKQQDVYMGIVYKYFDWRDLLHWKAADVNANGRTDLVHIMNLDGAVRVDTLMSAGDGGWVWPPHAEIPFDFQPGDTRFWRPLDLNGYGKTDLLHIDADNDKLHVSSLVSLAPLDLLASVSNGYGATTSINYRSSSDFPATDLLQGCFLPVGLHLQVVSSTIITDSHTPELADTESYSYSCAHWSYRERGLLSWGSVTSSRESTYSRAASQTVDSYLASDSCLVQLQGTQLVDGSGNLYSSTTYNFVRPVVDPPYQCQVASTDQQELAVDDEKWYCYDAFGNIVRQFEAPGHILLGLGDNVCGSYPTKTGPFSNLGSGLLRTTLRIYHPAVGPYIVSLPAWQGVFPNIITDASLEKPSRSTFYCYDNDNGTATTNCSGLPSQGLLTATREVDDAGQFATTTYIYDSYGNQTDVIGPRAYVFPLIPFGYFPSGRFPRVRSIAYGGQTYLVVLGDAGRVWGKTASGQQVLLYAPHVYSSAAADGNQTHTDHDPTYHIYPIKVCTAYHTPLQECTTKVWNEQLGLITSSTDANNNTTTFPYYDPFGRLQETDYPNGMIEHRAYYDGVDPNQPSVHEWVEDGSSDGLWTNTYLDGLRRTYRVTKKSDAPGGTFAQDTIYADASSLIYRQSHWYTVGAEQPVYEEYHYDGASRLVKQIHPGDGSFLSWVYGNNGTNTSVTSYDELWHERTVFSDVFGRVSQVREKNQGQYATTTYAYNEVDEVLSVTDASGNLTEYGWDMLGRQTSVLDPDRGLWTYHYYLNGNLLSQTDAKGVTLTFTYDVLNRLRTKQYPNKAKVAWNYDEPGHGEGIGQLTSISDPTGAGAKCKGGVTDSYSYNEMGQQLQQNGQVTSQTQCVDGKSYPLTFTYDLLGRLSQTTYPGSSKANKETVKDMYDPAGRLQSVSGYVSDLQYNAAGQVTKAVYRDQTETDYSYDPNREWLLCQVTVARQSSETSGMPGTTQPCEASSTPPTKPKFDATYHYSANGSVQSTSSSTNKMNENFTYDDLNQLLTVSGDWPQHLTYDATGNIKTNSLVGTYTYPVPKDPSTCHNGSQQSCVDYPQALQQAGPQKYIYDANGSITTASDSATLKKERLTWNDDHLLASITVTTATGKKTTAMAYEASGERVAETTKTYDRSGKLVKTASNYYFGSLLEYSSTRGLIKYYYAGSQLVAQNDGTGTSWYHQDRLGSTRIITNKQGVVVAQYDYMAFGQQMQESGSQQNEIGFTGQRTDAGIGMVYMHGRYYDPQLSRFISADPLVSDGLNPQALNRYAYVYNDPINNTDPSGYSPNDGVDGGDNLNDVGHYDVVNTPPPTNTPPPGNPEEWAPFPTPFTPPPLVSAPDMTPPPTTMNSAASPSALGYGFQVDLGAQICGGFCFFLGDYNFGMYFTPAQPNDTLPFHDFHFFFGGGISVLGITPGPDQKLGYVEPDIFMSGIGKGRQSSLGLAAGIGGSIQGFVTEAATPSNFSEWARALGVSLGPASVSLSKNSNAQRTLAFGLGPSKSLPAGISTYNTYTWVSGGGFAWLSGLENAIQRLYGVNTLLAP